ncbi:MULTISPECIES: BLUF domain-containing protein [Vibrio]|uniref:Blue light sensor protein n=1 Tax=Vibrio genomosp. F6 str. FF-238 TaxID=1191298 RepID=A0A1E5CX65_9VIBR|nr:MULTISPECIES: BLUF domain-containing protein [Vibrio]MDN3698346.1 BLUF domain-containing protein [Vibrio cortegadensis]NOH86086.1 BLUF domain-containing protein [Vibrio sp. 03-59-1]OEE75161.1 blue light sensor protein [Vibrio genomosp. F6 str. FF-238]TKF18034.1 BLUF domain-containing protein [Vibrio genomosp. F6]
MFLTRLIYVSTLSKDCDLNALTDILTTSREHNKEANITGLLSHNQKYFLQCLEGSREAINDTYSHIVNDKRHSKVTILYFKEVHCREFGDWSMGDIPQSHLTALLNLQFSGSDQFSPYDMSGESAYLMLLELKQNLPSE